MEQFFDNLKLPEITQDEIHDLNRPVIIKKKKKKNQICSLNLPKEKSPGWDHFTGEIFQTFIKEIAPILCNLFHKIEEEKIFLNLFCEACTTLIKKKIEDSTRPRPKNKLRPKNSQQNISRLGPRIYNKNNNIMFKWGLSQECKSISIFENQCDKPY